jgi:hypothetical protein
MKARDERVSLMNEVKPAPPPPRLRYLRMIQILGGIRMLKVEITLLGHFPTFDLDVVHGLGAQIRNEGLEGSRKGIEGPEA